MPLQIQMTDTCLIPFAMHANVSFHMSQLLQTGRKVALICHGCLFLASILILEAFATSCQALVVWWRTSCAGLLSMPSTFKIWNSTTTCLDVG